ncbi:acid phosphatase type 7 isoform X4 [Homo sapiens]|uniref:acid phosphatase type 7 isoform X4 n=1 Tax=Homo sapiens TaxID=9606 RepID=UPI0005CFFCA8|nr:acid phosphatase type 7 isoform X4 [Homo sapiens]XP_054176983.1 acid phosphatase type 7 isoform X4 [Homo sapiens]|eukprot:XP_011525271.1 acid phosphatase type 7 isoform X3 [Homo sapiens]
MHPLPGYWSCYCLLLLFSLGVQGSLGAPSAAPEQVHLSYPGEPGSMTVTWTTWVPTRSEVQFGLQPSGPLPLRAQGTFVPFVDGGILRRKLYIHRVTLRKLLPGVQYVYRCGSAQGWSRRFRFRALKNGAHWSPRLAVFGDLGADNPKAVPRLRRDTQQGMYDAVLHVGDFAYNLDQDNARVGDRFMRLIEPVAASLPYMTCPGNHEERYNFSNYKARFSMPGDNEGLWYSWDLGPAHIISFSTEVYFFLHYGRHLVQRQFRWLESDLQPIRTGQPGRGSSLWGTGPCTAPTQIWTTAHDMKARSAKASKASCTGWRIFSTNMEWICSCGLMSTRMNDCGQFTTTRYLTAAERCPTPTREGLSTSSQDLLMGRS